MIPRFIDTKEGMIEDPRGAWFHYDEIIKIKEILDAPYEETWLFSSAPEMCDRLKTIKRMFE